MYIADINIIVLEGHTVASVEHANDEVSFVLTDGREFKLYHLQDCCEYVSVESGAEDLPKLVGKTIVKVLEIIEHPENTSDSATRTTFEFVLKDAKPIKLVWLGTSNGYYSESVSFCQTK